MIHNQMPQEPRTASVTRKRCQQRPLKLEFSAILTEYGTLQSAHSFAPCRRSQEQEPIARRIDPPLPIGETDPVPTHMKLFSKDGLAIMHTSMRPFRSQITKRADPP